MEKYFYSDKFEFGFCDIAWDERSDEIIATVFMDVIKPLTGQFKRIIIEDSDIRDFAISCCFDELKDMYMDKHPEIALKILEEKIKNEEIQDGRH